MATSSSDLETLDTALVTVRRFLEAPRIVDDHGRDIELSTLLILAGLPTMGQSIRDIATRLDVAPSTASRLVSRAERAGVVTKSPATGDARSAVVTPTREGRELASRAAEHRRSRLAEVLAGWSDEQVRALALSLDEFARAHLRDRAAKSPGVSRPREP